MKCEKVREMLPLYCGGEIEENGRVRLSEHLGGCAACRAELESIERARSIAMKTLRRIEAPAEDADFWAGIERRIAAAPVRVGTGPVDAGEALTRSGGRQGGILRTAFAFAAAAALVVLAGVGIDRSVIDPRLRFASRSAGSTDRHPIIESVNDPNVTVMTFETDDPHITIAWFFEEENGKERR